MQTFYKTVLIIKIQSTGQVKNRCFFLFWVGKKWFEVISIAEAQNFEEWFISKYSILTKESLIDQAPLKSCFKGICTLLICALQNCICILASTTQQTHSNLPLNFKHSWKSQTGFSISNIFLIVPTQYPSFHFFWKTS